MARLKSALLVSTAATLFGVASPAQAQQTPPETDKPAETSTDEVPAVDDGRIGEILVTAQRRSEALQRVPVAATVITGESFINSGGLGVEDLQKLSPSVTFDSTTSARNNSVRIRGIGSNTTSSAIEPETSTVLDGVVLARQGQSSSALLLDLDRIEVLRGPQGTLFGKNASAGVLNITTKNPSSSFEGSIGASVTNDSDVTLRGVASGPLSDNVGIRVGGFFRDFKGTVDNVASGRTLNDSTAYALHGKLRYESAADFSATIGIDYAKQDSNCCARPLRELDPVSSRAVIEALALLPVVAGPENVRVNNDTESRDDNVNFISSLQLEKGLGEFTLNSITAYQSFKILQALDNDLLNRPNGPVAGGVPVTGDVIANEVVHGVSQELRLTSPTWDLLDFVFGLYGSRATTRFAAALPRKLISGGNVVNQVSDFVGDTTFVNFAGFGQVNVHITEDLTILAGGRLTYDKVNFEYERRDDPTRPFRGGDVDFERKTTETNLSVKTGLQYEFTPDIFGYATYAQGYKGPGFSVASDSRITDPVVRPETADSYEIGTKLRLFDRRVGLNIAFFNATYNDFAINVIDVATTSNQLRNAAKLKTKGFEIEYDIRPLRNLSVSGGLAYVDATFDAAAVPCYSGQTSAQGCVFLNGVSGTRVQNLVNAPVINSSKWQFNIGSSYKIQTQALPFDLDLGVGYNYSSGRQLILNQDPEGRIGPVGLLEARIGFISKGGDYRVELFGKNLTDKFYPAAIGDAPSLPGSKLQFIPRDYHRYIGIRFSADF